MTPKLSVPTTLDDLINGYYGRGDVSTVTSLEELFGSHYGTAPELGDELLTSSYGKPTTEDLASNGRRPLLCRSAAMTDRFYSSAQMVGPIQEYVVGDTGGPQFEEYVVASKPPATIDPALSSVRTEPTEVNVTQERSLDLLHPLREAEAAIPREAPLASLVKHRSQPR